MVELVPAVCGAGLVILCESEYSCWRLFKKRGTLFFQITQLAILSSVLGTVLTSFAYFIPTLQTLVVFLIIISVIKFLQDISYLMMMLLRLRFIWDFSIIIAYIPLLQDILWTTLRYFWISWILTSNNHYYKIFSVIQPISTILFTVQNVAINIFFIIVAIKTFEDVISIKHVIIVNIIVIIFECVVVIIEFLFVSTWIVWVVIAIVSQIRVRLEIDILVYIVRSVRHETDANTGESQHLCKKMLNIFRFT